MQTINHPHIILPYPPLVRPGSATNAAPGPSRRDRKPHQELWIARSLGCDKSDVSLVWIVWMGCPLVCRWDGWLPVKDDKSFSSTGMFGVTPYYGSTSESEGSFSMLPAIPPSIEIQKSQPSCPMSTNESPHSMSFRYSSSSWWRHSLRHSCHTVTMPAKSCCCMA